MSTNKPSFSYLFPLLGVWAQGREMYSIQWPLKGYWEVWGHRLGGVAGVSSSAPSCLLCLFIYCHTILGKEGLMTIKRNLPIKLLYLKTMLISSPVPQALAKLESCWLGGGGGGGKVARIAVLKTAELKLGTRMVVLWWLWMETFFVEKLTQIANLS